MNSKPPKTKALDRVGGHNIVTIVSELLLNTDNLTLPFWSATFVRSGFVDFLQCALVGKGVSETE